MKKLLLLTTLPLTAFMSTFAGKVQTTPPNPMMVVSDSLIKEHVVAANPRAGFKNLFDKGTVNGITARLNPQAVSFVQDYMQQHTDDLTKMKTWGQRYFSLMDGILSRHGLPTELKYLSVIESELQSSAVSWAGAVGPWQFMPATARLMGLKVGNGRDERRDFTKSTNAAAKYLGQLFNYYQDWLLVIAAYNGGQGNVDKAIRRSGSRNFWALQYHLPTESRNHVKKFIATHYIMEGNGGVTTLTKKETELAYATANAGTVVNPTAPAEGYEQIQISGRYNAAVIAQNLSIDAATFNKLNPGLDNTLAATGSYTLTLPADKALSFQAAKPQILEQSLRFLLAGAK